jgi:hypothetical protein
MTPTGDDLELSPYDKVLVRSVQTALLVFSRPIPTPAETIKTALSQALVHYQPIAGRLHAGVDGGFAIKCSGEGVSFVAASADCAMEDTEFSVGSVVATALLDELATYYEDTAGGCPLIADPLLMVQVTEFRCGGFVVGVTWSHALADAAGMGQFLQAVGELSRGLPHPSVIPVRWDKTLAAIVPHSGAVAQCFKGVRPIEMAQLSVHVPSSATDKIKDSFRHGRRDTCTVFEVVSAMLWQCRTRAVMSDPKAPTVLLFSANVRKLAGAKEGYYGNCLAAQVVVARSGAVAGADIVDLVQMVRRAKERIPDQFRQGGDGSNLELESPLGFGYNNIFIVTCWRNLALEDADFGGGRPTRVMSHKKNKMGMPTCFITGDGKQGSYVLSGCVKGDHAHTFLTELERFTW